jgi:Gpi18-like mannosyltransferase
MPQVSRGRGTIDKQEAEAEALKGTRWSVALIALGIVLRLAIAVTSKGTNDAAAWLRFGDEINQHGLIETYRSDRDFNHPPIPAYWAALCAQISGSEDSPLHDSIFTIVFKLPVIVADCAGIYLLWLIWRSRNDNAGALRVAAWFALSLDAILISAYHCNTDPIYVMLCLLCAYLLEKMRYLVAWLALGAAINIKLIPVLLIVPLLLTARNRYQAMRFIAGLALWVLPFVPLLILARKAFLANVLMYNSMVDRWGIDYFLLLGQSKWTPANHGEQLAAVYYAYARYLIFALILLWALLSRWRMKW